MPLSNEELKNKAEALLFSIGKRIDISEIAKLLRFRDMEQLTQVLNEIKSEYDSRNSPMIVVNDGPHWKIVVREKYTPVVKKVVADVELSKTLIETLAMVAWKNPVKQSEIIEIRSNKGYDHLDELERMGFITRKKYGRTKLISLTEKFFNYFELSGHEDIKEAFRKMKEIEEQKMREYAEKRALADMKKKKSAEVKIINQKAFLEKIDRQLENKLDKEEKGDEQHPPLEREISEEQEKKEGGMEKAAEESSAEEEKGTEEESKSEDYEEKLDEKGMPNLEEDKNDEEEEVLDEEEEKKKESS